MVNSVQPFINNSGFFRYRFAYRLPIAFLLLLLSSSTNLFAVEVASTDSTVQKLKPIELGNIAIRASEIRIDTQQKNNDLISNQSIRKLYDSNNLILSSIKNDIQKSKNTNDSILSIRNLETRQIILLQQKRKIEKQKLMISEVVHSLDSLKYDLLIESERWKLTKSLVEKDSLLRSTPLRLDETINFLDSTIVNISAKSKAVLEILDRTIGVEVAINSQYDRNRKSIDSKQQNVFRTDHVPLWKMSSRLGLVQVIKESFKTFINADWIELKTYLKANLSSLVFGLLLLAGLIYLFVKIRRKTNLKERGFGFIYKATLFKIISNPISASIVLTLFSSLIVFPELRPVFREFTFYIMVFPLIRILTILIDKRSHIYVYNYGLVVLFYALLLMFSSGYEVYRLLLLLIAISEIALLGLFLFRYLRKSELIVPAKRILFSFVYLHLGFAIIGLVGNLTGRIVLTEIMLLAVFFNIYHGLIIFISTILINGLIATLIDMPKSQKINTVRLKGEMLKQKLIKLINFLAVSFWFLLILSNFQLLQPLYESFSTILTHTIKIGSASFSLDDFLIFFIVIYVAVLLSQMLQLFLEEDVLNRLQLSKGLPHTIAMLVKYTLITLGFFLAVNAAGIPVDKLTIILGAMSVGIGFGLQNIFNNLVSGLILLFERPIQLGDTVQVGQLTGNVQSIGLRSSNIKTFDGAEVIVPNGQLIANELINWTLSDQQRRLEVTVGVGYQSDPILVQKLLLGILEGHPEILNNPKPLVFFSELGNSSLNFSMLAWIPDYNEGRRVKSEVLFNVFKVLKANQIEIPFPQHDLHLRSVDPGISFGSTLK
jgi:small-conductance mechanosensitive channel